MMMMMMIIIIIIIIMISKIVLKYWTLWCSGTWSLGYPRNSADFIQPALTMDAHCFYLRPKAAGPHLPHYFCRMYLNITLQPTQMLDTLLHMLEISSLRCENVRSQNSSRSEAILPRYKYNALRMFNSVNTGVTWLLPLGVRGRGRGLSRQ